MRRFLRKSRRRHHFKQNQHRQEDADLRLRLGHPSQIHLYLRNLFSFKDSPIQKYGAKVVAGDSTGNNVHLQTSVHG